MVEQGTIQSATQQADGSVRVVCGNGTVCFVPNAEGNRDFEHIAREIVADRLVVQGATPAAQLSKAAIQRRLADRQQRFERDALAALEADREQALERSQAVAAENDGVAPEPAPQ